jgi:hypothetical protein
MNAINFAVSHMNAPFGNELQAAQLVRALRCGKLEDPDLEPGAALVSYLFVELEPRTIVNCAIEAGSDLHHANELYLDIVSKSSPRSIQWEKAVEHLL